MCTMFQRASNILPSSANTSLERSDIRPSLHVQASFTHGNTFDACTRNASASVWQRRLRKGRRNGTLLAVSFSLSFFFSPPRRWFNSFAKSGTLPYVYLRSTIVIICRFSRRRMRNITLNTYSWYIEFANKRKRMFQCEWRYFTSICVVQVQPSSISCCANLGHSWRMQATDKQQDLRHKSRGSVIKRN